MEGANQSSGKTFGAFHDPIERFATIANVRPLLPIIAGPVNKIVCSVFDDISNEILMVALEHLGFFLPKNEQITKSEAYHALTRMMKIAQTMIDSNDTKPLIPLEKYPTEAIPADVEIRKTMEASIVLLNTIHGLIETRGVKYSKPGEVVAVVASVRARLCYVPASVFEDLAGAYVDMYKIIYPFFKEVESIAMSCDISELFPKSITRKLLLPLVVPQNRTVNKIVKLDEEEVTIAENWLFFTIFKGFLYSADTSAITSWDGIDKGEELAKPTIVLSKTDFGFTLKLEENIQRLVKAEAAKNPKWKAFEKKLMDEVNFYNSGSRMAQHAFQKTVKLLCQTSQGLGILQNQMRMNFKSGSITEAPTKFNQPNIAPNDYLTFLMMAFQVNDGGYKQIIRASHGSHPLGMFGVVDVSLLYDDNSYGSINTSPGSTPPKTIKLHFIKGDSDITTRVNSYYGTKYVVGNPKYPTTKGIPVLGTLSVFNSTEFTEFGNLGLSEDNLKSDTKKYLMELTAQDFNKFCYEVKWNHGAVPNSLPGIMYTLRHTIITTVGGMMAVGAYGLNPSNTSCNLSSANPQIEGAMSLIMEQGLKGFFGRAKPILGSKGYSFELTSSLAVTKGKALFNNKNQEMLRTSHKFAALEWISSEKTKRTLEGKISKRMTNLSNLHDVKKMIIDLESQNGTALYYLRPAFATPMGLNLPTSTVVSNKSAYNNAPVAFNVGYNVCCVNGQNWCTTEMDGVLDWKQHAIYKIILDKNRLWYNPETVKRWSTLGGKPTEGETHSTDEIVSALLSEVDEDEPVTTSTLNSYGLSKDVFDIIVTKLSILGRYENDGVEVYAEAADPSEEMNISDETQEFSKKRKPEEDFVGIMKKKKFTFDA